MKRLAFILLGVGLLCIVAVAVLLQMQNVADKSARTAKAREAFKAKRKSQESDTSDVEQLELDLNDPAEQFKPDAA